MVTGFRPDLAWLSEVRLDLDPVLSAPTKLAPLIDPNVHSCGTVYPHGAAELAQPEQGLYLAGMKSYGRAPSFLALTGFEQTRSIVAAIAGDHDAAARVELVLPESGRLRRLRAVRRPAAGARRCRAAELDVAAQRRGGGLLAPDDDSRSQVTPLAGPRAAGARSSVLCFTEIVSWGVLFYAFTGAGHLDQRPARAGR